MDKKEKVTLQKIADHADTISTSIKDIKNAKEYTENRLVSDAVAFNLLQIGELAHDGLTEETKKNLNAIPWAQIYGLRNRIVHGYAGVDYNIIYQTITEDVPELSLEIKKCLQQDSIETKA